MLAVVFAGVYRGFRYRQHQAGQKPADEVEFKTGWWAAMMFSRRHRREHSLLGRVGMGLFLSGPPFGIAAGSPDAVRWASTYGLFHWGPVAWAIYLVPAVSIAYFAHVRSSPVLKVSQSLMPLFGEKFTRSNWGKLLDVFFVFGMIGGGATTLGLASPMITEGLYELLGTPNSLSMQLGVLLLTTMIFAYSAYQGLKNGIQFLSNINFYLAMAFLIFVLLAGPTVFILNTGLESIGRSVTEMVRMMTWTEAFGQFEQHGFKRTHFPQDWTVFYWAWWLVFAPTIGLFIAENLQRPHHPPNGRGRHLFRLARLRRVFHCVGQLRPLSATHRHARCGEHLERTKPHRHHIRHTQHFADGQARDCRVYPAGHYFYRHHFRQHLLYSRLGGAARSGRCSRTAGTAYSGHSRSA